MQFEHIKPRRCSANYLEVKQDHNGHENNTTLVTFALFGFGSKTNESYSSLVNVTMVTLFKRPTRRHPAERIYVSLISQGVPRCRDLTGTVTLARKCTPPNMAANSEESSHDLYAVQLYDKEYLRPRTTDIHGLHLPDKQTFSIHVDPNMLDDNKEYSIPKRLEHLEKRLHGGKSREKRGTFRKENLLLVDLERTTALKELITGEIPVFALKTFKEKGEKRYMEFSLSKSASDDLRQRDQQRRLEAAMKIAFANYLHWSRLYEEIESKSERSAFEQARHEDLEDYLRNPLECKGVVYCYLVIDESQTDDKKYQFYIGGAEGEFTRKIKEHNTSGNKPLLELTLQDKTLWPVEDQHLKRKFKESLPKPSDKKGDKQEDDHVPKLDYEPKVVVITLDFGYTESFAENFKSLIDSEDMTEKLAQSYAQYFAAKSPIGLNG